MTKDVLISISGLQFAGGENSEPVEVITSGSYYKKNGRHYILYDEVAEDTAGTTKNIIKLGDEVLDITKRGETNVHMMFEKDKKNVTYYYTPYGNLLIGIDATKVQVEETEHNLSVKGKGRTCQREGSKEEEKISSYLKCRVFQILKSPAFFD